ncbi:MULTISPECIES: hypothetical protein [unclassified Acinetobacter]|uniref:hypothetical protein n=1 Tax=unclassified Acinetobacter TaxID=196816 RepID=UPI002447ACF2|nr:MULTISPECIES: hypothetical protein [unclassified Acinetobacter]MDH0031366.1 hypothetical protein [Acinetobacter sp. GD04021]MDH0887149.1 hypothetical protein [Acinetobacter sp. GD03873]MDH1083562.1 hypothetical protein [Acinetobacter sp. GD03983]MDH2190465.1 hypothetical protein [Acinetobacter sp. GD03645]MDH2204089.1 hypothetical protein [Acinetobacter sp. GD03647]
MKQKPISSQTSQRLHQHPTAADLQASTLEIIKANLIDSLKLLPVLMVIFMLWVALTFVVYGMFGG